MYRFRSTKYLAATGLIIALIVVVGLVCYAVKITSRGVFQISDGLLLSLALFIPGPMMLVAGPISGGIVDLISSAFPYIPATIVIHFLMPILVKALHRFLTSYGAIFVAALMTFIYPVYEFLLSYASGLGVDGASSAAFVELINDAIQTGVTIVFGIVLFVVLDRINVKVNNCLWDDGQFDIYRRDMTKNKKKKTGKGMN